MLKLKGRTTLENPDAVRAFGVLQVALLVVIVASIYLFRRRQKFLSEDTRISFDRVIGGAGIRRAQTFVPPKPPPPGQSSRKSDDDAEPVAALESAFPSWSKDTPPHEVLGISPAADARTVEAAYKRMLKKYHPDRFASWGKGYQTRAHHVVLLIQQARDKLLAGRQP